MKPTKVLALAALAGPSAAQLRSFADSLNLVDNFLRDLQTSVIALSTPHPRRSFHRRVPGQHAKRCIRTPHGSPGNHTTHSTSSTLASGSTSTSSSSTATRSSTRGSTSRQASTSTLTSTSTSTSASTSTSTTTSTSTSTTSSTSSAPTPSSTWSLQTTIAGSSFFDAWDFWSLPDPTNGAVDYQTQDGSESAGLISVNSAGNAIMRVETTQQVSGNRKSVRVHSKVTFNGGLVILDAVHMPYGCGTWPAFWSNGPNWPNNGEIDIVEGVNGYTRNQASLHTRSGCTIPANYGALGTLAATGDNALNCAAEETGNQGCGQLSSQANNYGKAFNDNGGGVYAMKWDTSGISVFFFPREAIPSDITAGQPMPSTWGTPAGNWPAQNCDPFQFMKDHIMIFDTTLCGDWAGNGWNTAGVGGQGASCAASTGYSTCLDYIRNEGSAFTDAYWEVKSVKLYT
ncbi:glycoside hydrolase family 16 protein [Ceratobasidium sp. AG-Ba]|nr:glycoside hydrolase family 16 protein [Ceratobasidium sp. AG-Ba]